MKATSTLILVILLSLYTSKIIAQEDQWIQYSVSKNIRSIAPEGEKLWIATHTGLVEYNKLTGVPLVYNNANSGLTSNFMLAVTVDPAGVKWIGSLSAGLFSFNGNNWENYNVVNSGIPSNLVIDIAIDSEGHKWLATDQGVAFYNDTTWTVWNSSNSALPVNDITAICVLSDTIWVATHSAGIASWDGSSWTVYNAANSGFPNDFSTSIAAGPSGIWIGTYGSGLVHFDRSNFFIYDTLNSGIPENAIESVNIEADGIIWAGTQSKGLARMEGNAWQTYNTLNSGLPSDYHITDVVADNGVEYIGTLEEGLVKFDGLTWESCNTSNSGLPTNDVRWIEFDSQDNAWIATGKGLVEYNGIDWTVYNSSNSPLPVDQITTLHIENDIIWIGAWGGLIKYDGSEWVVYTSDNSDLYSDGIFDIDIDTTGIVWLGCDRGVSSFDGVNFTNYTNDPLIWEYGFPAIETDHQANIVYAGGYEGTRWFNGTEWVNLGVPYGSVEDIAIDQEGNRWLATSQGLIYSTDGGYTLYNYDNTGLYFNWVYHVELDTEQVVWAAADGLLRYDGVEWTQFTSTNSGLPTSSVNHIKTNDYLEKWISTGAGIAVYSTEADPTDTKQVRRDNHIAGYPNPFAGELNINAPGQHITDYTILNAIGQSIMSGSFKEKITINTRGLKPGMYVIRTKSALGTGVVKCLKM